MIAQIVQRIRRLSDKQSASTGESPEWSTPRAARQVETHGRSAKPHGRKAAAVPGTQALAKRLLRASHGPHLPACHFRPDLPDVRGVAEFLPQHPPSGRRTCRSSLPPRRTGRPVRREKAGLLQHGQDHLRARRRRRRRDGGRPRWSDTPAEAAAGGTRLTRPGRSRPCANSTVRRSRDVRRRRAGGRRLRSLAYTQPTSRVRSPAAEKTTDDTVPRPPSPAGQRATDASLRAQAHRRPRPQQSNSPTTTPGSPPGSPAHSATSGQHGPDQVTIPEAEPAGIRPRASWSATTGHDGTQQVTRTELTRSSR